MHEALYRRSDLPKSKKSYAFDEHNVLLLCHGFHMQHGQESWFQREAAKLLVERYGEEAIQFYLESAPLRYPLHLEQLLWVDENGET